MLPALASVILCFVFGCLYRNNAAILIINSVLCLKFINAKTRKTETIKHTSFSYLCFFCVNTIIFNLKKKKKNYNANRNYVTSLQSSTREERLFKGISLGIELMSKVVGGKTET
jgi:hypothetical protein